MKIILVRHGEAEDIAIDKSDFQRNLTSKGIDDVHKIGNFIYNSHIVVKEIYHSPYLRTTQTAKIIANELHLQNELISPSERLSVGSDCSELLPCLNSCSNSDAILMVAHNPDISYFAAKLLGDKNFAERILFSPGTTVALNVARENFCKGQILWAISPDFLPSVEIIPA